MGGKIVRIQHVLNSIPLLQMMQPPKAVSITVGKICNSFLWDHNRDSKQVHWASWDRLCYSPQEGGLDFHFDVLRAFVCKLWWHLRKNDSIWSKFIHHKYIKGAHPSLVEVERPSTLWRRHQAIHHIMESQICWSLDECLVNFWHDIWCGDEPLVQQLDVTGAPHMLVGEFCNGPTFP